MLLLKSKSIGERDLNKTKAIDSRSIDKIVEFNSSKKILLNKLKWKLRLRILNVENPMMNIVAYSN